MFTATHHNLRWPGSLARLATRRSTLSDPRQIGCGGTKSAAITVRYTSKTCSENRRSLICITFSTLIDLGLRQAGEQQDRSRHRRVMALAADCKPPTATVATRKLRTVVLLCAQPLLTAFPLSLPAASGPIMGVSFPR